VRSPLVGPLFNARVAISKMERLGQIGRGVDLCGPRRGIKGRRHDLTPDEEVAYRQALVLLTGEKALAEVEPREQEV
jgi:aspartate carbamoyltransferase catalytic subunit